jgi:hypothetical protein
MDICGQQFNLNRARGNVTMQFASAVHVVNAEFLTQSRIRKHHRQACVTCCDRPYRSAAAPMSQGWLRRFVGRVRWLPTGRRS